MLCRKLSVLSLEDQLTTYLLLPSTRNQVLRITPPTAANGLLPKAPTGGDMGKDTSCLELEVAGGRAGGYLQLHVSDHKDSQGRSCSHSSKRALLVGSGWPNAPK